ncbi:MAG TPA: hypothetical protein VGS20_05120 [Candidatus Acidoferrales bacterium]|nr:hypothetical protein [Candidatus Acidoferrales bacterium]
MSVRGFRGTVLAGALALLGGCASRTTRVTPPGKVAAPALEASKQDLVARYNRQAAAIQSLNAAVQLKAVTGSAFAGVIKEYRQIDGYILAQRPAWIRVIGQAPVVGTDIFDMASDGTTFGMYIPSKRKFLVGPARGEQTAKNALENLRPQHLVDALFWPDIPPDQVVVIEQETEDQPPSRDYVLTLLRGAGRELAIDRRIWFDRSNLEISRIEIFGSDGRLESDLRYDDWSTAVAASPFARHLSIRRPYQDYRLEISFTRLTLNQPIPPERFRLEQPPGTEKVEVGRSEERR